MGIEIGAIFTAIGGSVIGVFGGAVTGTAAASTALFTVSTGVATAIGIGATIITFGGVALSVVNTFSQKDFGSSSPTYGNGIIQTQTDQNMPIPLLYGTCKLAGNRIWQDENATTTVRRIVAFAEGEICGYSDIKLNNIPKNDIAGISIKEYYGTANQEVDGIIAGANQAERAEKVGSLKNVAYLAITVPRSAKIDVNYNLTAVVKGRKVRVYKNIYEYEIKYSENPAWVMFDFLTCYNGLGLCINNYGNISEELVKELFDLESFIEAAAYCDELIDYKHTDKDGNEVIDKVPRFTFNMIFDSQTSARTLIDEIYRSCRGGLFIKNGKLQFKIDKAEPVSRIFTENDIIKGSETFEAIPKEEHYDILKCTYVSPDHEWQKVEATAELPEYRDGVPIEHSVNIYSCTSFNQASRLAWYYVNTKRIQPYFGSFKTDYKGYDLEVGDVIMIDSLLMGLKRYAVKVTSVTDDGAGVFTVDWRTYDDRLYSDELGSKEPRVLVSNLEDIAGFPDDVANFNVVQTNNIFNFVWSPNTNATDTYEIRVGNSWETGALVKSGIRETKYSYEIPTNGLYRFWIKAFNGYNYSEHATLDLISVDSVPSLNEIVKIDVLSDMQGTLDDTLRVYRNTIKLKENDIKWHNTNDNWGYGDTYYQASNRWGAAVNLKSGTYESQVYDIGAVLESIVTFDYNYTSADAQNNVYIEWAFSDDNVNFTPWSIANTGLYKFRYCKFRATLNSYNNVQVVLTNFVVNVDVPDKDLNLELEITDSQGLTVEYDFIKPPSIVATVNDNNDAYIVVTQKTEKFAHIVAYTNAGELTTCKFSMRVKGY